MLTLVEYGHRPLFYAVSTGTGACRRRYDVAAWHHKVSVMHFHLRRHGHSHEAYPDVKSALERIKLRAHDAAADPVPTTSHAHTIVDVSVHVSSSASMSTCNAVTAPTLAQFIGANNIPKMHVVGSADPFFIATIDDKIKFMYGGVL